MLNIEKLIIKNQNNTLIDISFSINSSTALVGQSGSGKSLTLKAILKLLPSNLKSDFIYSSTFQLEHKDIGFIPQNPFTSLSPLTKIKDQFFCDNKTKLEILDMVDLDINTLDKFPAQLSGGQLQRVVIAITLAKRPKLLLLDEPTTALDKSTQTRIITLIKSLQKKFNFLILFVTHDITAIENICDDIIILKDGSIVESGITKDILENSKNIYTTSLINSNFSNREYRV